MLSKIEHIKQNNRETIINQMSRLMVLNYDTVSVLIPKLLIQGLLILNHSVYTPANPNEVGRYLVYDHPNKDHPFSIWVFAFAPRQKTLIHDHKYKGTVTVLAGPISEKYYQPTGPNSARLITRQDRYRFHTNRDDLTDTFVHQLKRRKGLGDGISVTLHIYNMPAHLLNLAGDKTDQRNLAKIYSKDKALLDKSKVPSYTKEYPQPSYIRSSL